MLCCYAARHCYAAMLRGGSGRRPCAAMCMGHGAPMRHDGPCGRGAHAHGGRWALAGPWARPTAHGRGARAARPAARRALACRSCSRRVRVAGSPSAQAQGSRLQVTSAENIFEIHAREPAPCAKCHRCVQSMPFGRVRTRQKTVQTRPNGARHIRTCSHHIEHDSRTHA